MADENMENENTEDLETEVEATEQDELPDTLQSMVDAVSGGDVVGFSNLLKQELQDRLNIQIDAEKERISQSLGAEGAD